MNYKLLLLLSLIFGIVLPLTTNAFSFVTSNGITSSLKTLTVSVGSASYNSFYFAFGTITSNNLASPTVTYNSFTPANIIEIGKGSVSTIHDTNTSASGNSLTDSLTVSSSTIGDGVDMSGVGIASTLVGNVESFVSNGVAGGSGNNPSISIVANNGGDTAFILGGCSAHCGSTAPTLPAGCTMQNTATVGGSYAFVANCLFASSGTFTANIGVIQSSVSLTIAAFVFATGTSTYTPISGVTISSNSELVDSGQNVYLSSSWSNGAEPFTANYVNQSNGGIQATSRGISGQSNTVSFVSGATGSFNYNVIVTDGQSTANSIEQNIVVANAMTTPELANVPNTIDSGQSLLITANIVANTGTSPYTFTYFTGAANNACSADASNVLATFSGVASTINSLTISPTTSNSYCVSVTDSANIPVTVNSVAANVVVNPTLSATINSIPALSTTINAHQIFQLTANAIGGTPAYTYNFLVANEVNGALLLSNQISGVTSNTETWSWNIPSAYAGDLLEFNVIVTDSVSGIAYSPTISTLTVNTIPAFVVGSVTPSQPIIAAAGSVVLQANPSGGVPSYSYQWWTGTNTVCNGMGNNAIIGATANVYTASPSLSQYYCYYVADSFTSNGYSGVDLVGVDGFCINVNGAGLCSSTFNFDNANSIILTASGTNTIYFGNAPIASSGGGGGGTTYTAGNGIAISASNVISVVANAPITVTSNGVGLGVSTTNGLFINSNGLIDWQKYIFQTPLSVSASRVVALGYSANFFISGGSTLDFQAFSCVFLVCSLNNLYGNVILSTTNSITNTVNGQTIYFGNSIIASGGTSGLTGCSGTNSITASVVGSNCIIGNTPITTSLSFTNSITGTQTGTNAWTIGNTPTSYPSYYSTLGIGTLTSNNVNANIVETNILNSANVITNGLSANTGTITTFSTTSCTGCYTLPQNLVLNSLTLNSLTVLFGSTFNTISVSGAANFLALISGASISYSGALTGGTGSFSSVTATTYFGLPATVGSINGYTGAIQLLNSNTAFWVVSSGAGVTNFQVNSNSVITCNGLKGNLTSCGSGGNSISYTFNGPLSVSGNNVVSLLYGGNVFKNANGFLDAVSGTGGGGGANSICQTAGGNTICSSSFIYTSPDNSVNIGSNPSTNTITFETVGGGGGNNIGSVGTTQIVNNIYASNGTALGFGLLILSVLFMSIRLYYYKEKSLQLLFMELISATIFMFAIYFLLVPYYTILISNTTVSNVPICTNTCTTFTEYINSTGTSQTRPNPYPQFYLGFFAAIIYGIIVMFWTIKDMMSLYFTKDDEEDEFKI